MSLYMDLQIVVSGCDLILLPSNTLMNVWAHAKPTRACVVRHEVCTSPALLKMLAAACLARRLVAHLSSCLCHQCYHMGL